MERDYATAVQALNTLQSNHAAVEAVRKAGPKKNEQSIPEMVEWSRKIGYEPAHFDAFKPIHIAGTKGKGSTSAFVSRILTQYSFDHNGASPRKVGLFTSPHLRFVRERIQINNEMLSEELFAKYFFDVWDRLEAAAQAEGLPPDAPGTKPMYFRFLNLMAFHTFLCEGVDTAVIECGIGGEYDSTNVILNSSVTAVTSLGIDHVEILGNSLAEIAWHKSGIFRPDVPALVAPQPEAAMAVLRDRAAGRGCSLTVVERHSEIDSIKLGLAADFQKTNASLAVAVAAAHLRKLQQKDGTNSEELASEPLPISFRRGLEAACWPGRCDVRDDRLSNIVWYIDGAHTLESIDVAGRWFASELHATPGATWTPRILLFNQQKRDAEALATSLYATLTSAISNAVNTKQQSPFTHVIFCTNVTFLDAGYRPDLVSINTNAKDVSNLTVQNKLAKAWKTLDEGAHVEVVGTIEEAIEMCRKIGGESVKNAEKVNVFVTGSLHLVGGVIEVLESD